MIPFVGGAFKRASFNFMQTEKGIDVPVTRFAEAFLRGVIVIGSVVAGFIYLAPMLTEKEIEVSNDDIVKAFAFDDLQFSEFLKNCDREQLVEVLDEWVVDPDVPFEDRQHVLLNQIKAAKKIARSRMTQLRIFGSSKELELRSDLALAHLKNNVFDPDQNKALIDLASLYKSIHFDESKEAETVNENARLAAIVGETVEIVETEQPENVKFRIDDLLVQVGELSEQFIDSSDTGKKLNKLAELSRTRLSELDKSTKFADQFENALRNIQNVNKSARIDNFLAMDVLDASASELIYLPEDKERYEHKFLADFRHKLAQILEVDDIDAATFLKILTKLEQIAESGWAKAAQEMLPVFMKVVQSKGDFPELESGAEKLRLRLDWIGRKLKLDGLKTLDNRSPFYRPSNALATMVIYISMANPKESDARFKQLGRIYNNVFRNAKIDFIVIFLHEDDQRNGLQAMRVLDNRMKPVDFWQLNLNSNEGKELSKRLAIDDVPYVKLLDRDRRVAAINPRSKIVVDFMNKLKAKE